MTAGIDWLQYRLPAIIGEWRHSLLSLPYSLHRSWQLLRIYTAAADCDWSSIAILMQHQIKRVRRHMMVCNIAAHTDRAARQMLIAEHLLHRLIADEYTSIAERTYPNWRTDNSQLKYWAELSSQLAEQDNQLLFTILRKHMRGWWD